MKKLILFKKTRKTVADKLSTSFYMSIIHSHDISLIIKHFTFFELIFVIKVIKILDIMSEAEIYRLRKEHLKQILKIQK